MMKLGLTKKGFHGAMKGALPYFGTSFILLGFMQTILANRETTGLEIVEDCDSLHIVAFGNSITAERKTVEKVFAQRLPSLLAEEGLKSKVSNAGIGGSHTGYRRDSDLFQIPHALDRLKQDVLDREPDLTIVGFGTNDSYIDKKEAEGPSRIPLEDFEKNLTYIIESLQSNGSKVILIAPNGLGRDYPDFQNERLLLYVDVVRKLSRKFGTGLLDNHNLFFTYDQVPGQSMDDLMLDGVHPNDMGHALMAQELNRIIMNMVSISNKN